MKLSPPPQPQPNIPRTHIDQLISSTTSARLLLIHGPAGYGKTTAMLQYHERLLAAGTVTSWLNLGHDDNDGDRFLASVELALMSRIERARPGSQEASQSSHAPAESVVDQRCKLEYSFALFMDQFEVIESPAALDLVRRIIRQIPVNGQLIIGTRAIPNLNVARLRANGQLAEIGPAQLRFSLEETSAWLRGKRTLALNEAEVRRLYDATEGWAAGLHLAELATSSTCIQRVSALTFSATHPGVAEYFSEDVLDRVTEELQTFMMRTSVLKELTAPLCDALLSHTDSERLLGELLRANLFLTPLDAGHTRFRYHRVFAAFLRERLQKREPPEIISELHLAASRWYAAADQPILAIEHALVAQDREQLLTLLTKHVLDLLRQGQHALLGCWYSQIPSSLFVAQPKLSIIFAEALASVRRFEEAQHLVTEALSASEHTPDSAFIRASGMLLQMRGALKTDRPNSDQPSGSQLARASREAPASLCSSLAHAHACRLMAQNRFDEALEQLDRSTAYQTLPYASCLAIEIARTRAMIDFARGRLRGAKTRLLRSVNDPDWDQDQGQMFGGAAGVLLAEFLYHSDELIESERIMGKCLALAIEHGEPDILIVGHVISARIAYASGKRERAFEILSDLERLGMRENLPRLAMSYRLERSRMALCEGDMAAAEIHLRYAEKQDIWAPFESYETHANDVERPAIGRIRLMVRQGRHAEVVMPLKQQLREAEQRGRHRRALQLKILLATALEASDQLNPALRVFNEALNFAATEGFVRTIADEGNTVIPLLTRVRDAVFSDTSAHSHVSETQVSNALIERVLQACGHQRTTAPNSDEIMPPLPVAPLTKSELRVLELVAQGLTNASVAEKLFVAPTTVNTHLRKINYKLGVSRRMLAVAVAQKLGLIANR